MSSKNTARKRVGCRRNWRAGITREHIGRIERDKCVPSIATLESIEKALGLSSMTLLQKKAEGVQKVEPSKEKNVGKSCRELERILATKLTEQELEKFSEVIDTFAELLKQC